MKNAELPKPKGQILIVTAILMSVLLMYGIALVNLAMAARAAENKENFSLLASNIAEAGVQKAVWCLNQTSGIDCGGTYGSGYGGENDISFGGGILDIDVSSISATVKQIEAAAYYPDKTKILGRSTVKAKAATNPDKASFVYALQIGAGGLELEEGAGVTGSVYSHGDITGATSALISGDAYVAGGTALAPDQADESFGGDFIFGKGNPQIDLAQSFIPASSNLLNKISVYLKRTSGEPGRIYVKIVNDEDGAPGSLIYASSSIDPSIVSTNYSWIDADFSSPPFLYSGIKYWIILDADRNSTKYWTIGADSFDEYAGGTALFSRNWQSYPWNAGEEDINFKTWSGGVTTKLENVGVGGNAAAHLVQGASVDGNAAAYTINDAVVEKDAWAYEISESDIGRNATTTNIAESSVAGDLWCESESNTSVGGTTYCPANNTPPADPGPVNMPISDGLIQDWKNNAESGDAIFGDLSISEDTSLGPKKINGNLTIVGGNTLTLTGTIYVTGSIIFENNSSVVLDAGYGSASGIIISDGSITINNGVSFSGAGTGSYLMLITTMNDGINRAIDVQNNSTTAILYAPYGIIEIKNNAILKSVCAFKLHARQGVQISYETGMSDISFSSGPAGGWSIIKGSRIEE